MSASLSVRSCLGAKFVNAHGYDAANNLTGFTSPDGSQTSYQYDSLNRLATLTNSITWQFGFSYDGLGRRTALGRPNGVSTGYQYDSLSRLLSVLHQAGGVTLDGASYLYDLRAIARRRPTSLPEHPSNTLMIRSTNRPR